MTQRDKLLLKKILKNQELLRSALKELKIASPSDLSNIHAMMRRGMMQTVGDIFELTVLMSDEVVKELPLQHDLIRQFRNTASHNYGEITNALAFMCITHCIDVGLIKVIREMCEDEKLQGRAK